MGIMEGCRQGRILQGWTCLPVLSCKEREGPRPGALSHAESLPDILSGQAASLEMLGSLWLPQAHLESALSLVNNCTMPVNVIPPDMKKKSRILYSAFSSNILTERCLGSFSEDCEVTHTEHCKVTR